MKKTINTFYFSIITTFFIGAFFWSGVLGFNDPVISGFGAILFMLSLSILIVYGLWTRGGNKIWAIINGILIFVSCFTLACFLGTISFMPNTEEARIIYGLISLPFIMCGASSNAAQIIIIII